MGACFLSAHVDTPGSQQRGGCVGSALSAVRMPTHRQGEPQGWPSTGSCMHFLLTIPLRPLTFLGCLFPHALPPLQSHSSHRCWWREMGFSSCPLPGSGRWALTHHFPFPCGKGRLSWINQPLAVFPWGRAGTGKVFHTTSTASKFLVFFDFSSVLCWSLPLQRLDFFTFSPVCEYLPRAALSRCFCCSGERRLGSFAGALVPQPL